MHYLIKHPRLVWLCDKIQVNWVNEFNGFVSLYQIKPVINLYETLNNLLLFFKWNSFFNWYEILKLHVAHAAYRMSEINQHNRSYFTLYIF